MVFKKPEAFSLKELCLNFHKLNKKQMVVQPYVSTIAVEGNSDIGLIVECEHAEYEMGIDMYTLENDEMGRLIRSVVGQQETSCPVFDPARAERKNRTD